MRKLFHGLVIAILMHISACDGSSGNVRSASDTNVNHSASGIRIMALGDSITHGVRLPIPSASWRLPFTQSMDNDGCTYEMVGSQLSNENHQLFESPHEAYSAQEANHFVSGHNNWAGNNAGIYSSMALHAPDVVLIHIGTNDAIQGQDNQQTIGEIDQIIAAILDDGGEVLIANLIPTFTAEYLEGVDVRIANLAELIESYVLQLSDPRVQIVDVREGYSQALMYDDGIHPNDEGSEIIATAFYREFKSQGFCRQ